MDTGFYNRKDVFTIAKELLGKLVVTQVNGKQTAGRIVETEAYGGIDDKASHAFGCRRTTRNEHMYHEAGVAYIYVCYGIHQMLNVVTNAKDIPDAVLIRALEPVEGIEIMAARTGKLPADKSMTSGPGNVCKALGINKSWSGGSLAGDNLPTCTF